VKPGDVLFVIDQRPYQDVLDQDKANLEKAYAQRIEMVWDQTSDEDRTIRWLLNELVASVGDLQ
jgi:multidrug resistance efflux pump